jgi:hypothetical protein
VTIAVSWRTGITGRSFRGRTYHLGLSEAQYVGSTLEVTPAGLILTAYDALLTTINAISGNQMGVLSRYADKAPRVNGLLTPISNVEFVDLVLDSQRRRLPLHGIHH